MARTATLAVLRASVLKRGQYENSSDINPTGDPSLLNEFINEAIAECWDLLVQRWADYYITRANQALVAGTELYALPTDFYKLRKVEIVDSSSPSGYRRLRPAELEASHEFGTPVSWHYKYRIEGGSLVIMPIPAQAETLRLFYIPYAARLVNDSDTFDGINGYEELVIQLAYKRCKEREELDTTPIDREIERLSLRIRDAADGRDATEPMTYNPRGPSDDSDWGGWDW